MLTNINIHFKEREDGGWFPIITVFISDEENFLVVGSHGGLYQRNQSL